MHKHLLLLLLATLALTSATAKVRLPHVLGDNMILQQDTEARLWGWDTPGKKVKVSVSWAKTAYTATTGDDGRWTVSVRTPKASYTPLSITFDDGEKTTLTNLLAGEVWLCTGQSNMEMPMKGLSGCPVEGYNSELVGANRLKGIHYCTVPPNRSMKPQEDSECQWKVLSSATIDGLSAVGYFFAKTLNLALDIPVGVIVAAKGGTRVECWLDYDNLKQYTDEPLDAETMVKRYPHSWHRPMVWGNATVNPVIKYTVKGIIYYQGCSNVGPNVEKYAERVGLLANQWRREMANSELPFYIVQIAPYAYGRNWNGIENALLQEQQWKASKTIPNSALICTADLVYPYEGRQIHPAQKRQVGERAAYHALNKQYGWKQVWCENPEYESMTISNDTCYVKLSNIYNGICHRDSIYGFEMAGADKAFHPAKAYIKGGKIIVLTCKAVKQPVAVRYAFHNVNQGNVVNRSMLPLVPFRTDDW